MQVFFSQHIVEHEAVCPQHQAIAFAVGRGEGGGIALLVDDAEMGRAHGLRDDERSCLNGCCSDMVLVGEVLRGHNFCQIEPCWSGASPQRDRSGQGDLNLGKYGVAGRVQTRSTARRHKAQD